MYCACTCTCMYNSGVPMYSAVALFNVIVDNTYVYMYYTAGVMRRCLCLVQKRGWGTDDRRAGLLPAAGPSGCAALPALCLQVLLIPLHKATPHRSHPHHHTQLTPSHWSPLTSSPHLLLLLHLLCISVGGARCH